ncbi:hypothetical protein F5Y13DRAFT_204434 [Hypoxylon sp. FL1857]|nr:hypothetical protein F5Y13DRAFT_204434 [Hypoxylon sp. FL1857]
MAIESRKVDPLDQVSLQQFFDDYVHRNEWTLELYRMYTVLRLPELISVTSELVRNANHLAMSTLDDSASHFSETATEFARKVRTFYIREISINLFHRVPGDDELLFVAPYREWAVRFWHLFSAGEIGQVTHGRIYREATTWPPLPMP